MVAGGLGLEGAESNIARARAGSNALAALRGPKKTAPDPGAAVAGAQMTKFSPVHFLRIFI